MHVEDFVKILAVDFYTGVPDSLLSPLCNYLYNTYGVEGRKHIVAANEGNAAAIAAGYHLATGKIPAVYMQNSGEGNIINPMASLLNEKIYAIPMIFIIGWRGEPGTKDEPQHMFQGEITLNLLESMGIEYCIVDKNTSADDVALAMEKFMHCLQAGKCVAFVVRKGALTAKDTMQYANRYSLSREEVIRSVAHAADTDVIVATTGKAGRELYEIREVLGQGHQQDFLTVGSMGYCSSLALGIALQKTQKKVWCIDGDGAMLMHMGVLAIIGDKKPGNLVHVVINNGAHESVGGMPTAAKALDLSKIACACGYPRVVVAATKADLEKALQMAKKSTELIFIEVKCSLESRAGLGRPRENPQENKDYFMKYLCT